METPEGSARRSWPGPRRRPGLRGSAGEARATVLGSLTIPGHPEQVAAARAFVSRTLSSHRVGADSDTATLLTSEIVTNAIRHTRSGPGQAHGRTRRPGAGPVSRTRPG